MLVIVAPGQGAQTPGFLNPWLELDGAADRLRQWSTVAGLDLVRYGTEASEDEIKDTAVAQPLLVAAGLLTAGVLFADGPGPVSWSARWPATASARSPRPRWPAC